MARRDIPLAEEPLWYKDAIIYEVHVKSFYDSNGDGIGDFGGLTDKLDYLADLGVTALWLLPFYPSPLKDDGYDIADYMTVHPDYGTLNDFRKFLREAHKRGLRVITELVINHTSDQHEWFRRARKEGPDGPYRDYYVWSDTPERYKDARIIFKDFETSNWSWDPVAKAYFWHRFYSHQPDLNFDNPQVQKEVLKVLDHWFSMGVDGLRLDAVPYLFEREGTNCENLDETYECLRQIRSHIDGKYKNRMLLAEANQWPEDAVAYFGEGDSCHMAFHFPLMPRMFMSVQMEDRFPIIDILDQTPEIPENCQWALFLRNHDELTLEMVTDEERDYMYRMYAREARARINLGIRRRLAPLLENDRRKIELMNVMLFSLPGSVVLYYGDELGMGDNFYLGDRDGVRTPMQWSADRNAGFSKTNPQRLYLPVVIDPEYHYEAVNVDNQERNRSSLLWWMRNFISTRKRFKAFGRGSIEFLLPDNPKVLTYVREWEDEVVLCVFNLSRYPQLATLDLSRFEGMIPEEVFSRNRFPEIRQRPYVFTLGAHGYYLFSLVREEAAGAALDAETPAECADMGSGAFLDSQIKDYLVDTVLPAYLKRRGWLGWRVRRFKEAEILEAVPVGSPERPSWLVIAQAHFTDGQHSFFNLVVSFAFNSHAAKILAETPRNVLCTFRHDGRPGIVFEGLHEDESASRLPELMLKRQSFKGHFGELSTQPGRSQADLRNGAGGLKASTYVTQRVNTTIGFGNRLFVKIFRQADAGMNPDQEMSRHLSEGSGFEHTPTYLGSMEYRVSGAEPVTVAVMKQYVHAETDARDLCLDALSRYMERLLSLRGELDVKKIMPDSPVDAVYRERPDWLRELLSESDMEIVRLMGRRTAELHLVLAGPTLDPDFEPEEFSRLYQRSVYQSVRSDIVRVLTALESRLEGLEDSLRRRAEQAIASKRAILDSLKKFHQKKIRCLKIRVHGDYHLGHLLYTGKDFQIIDFEGKPEKPLSQRRLKRSPFRDVADMQRSFFYTAFSALNDRPRVRLEDRAFLGPWLEAWHLYAFGAFLSSYLERAGGAPFVPASREELEIMLGTYLVDKAFLELGNAQETGDEEAMSLAIYAIESLVRWGF